jgi:cytochrome c553
MDRSLVKISTQGGDRRRRITKALRVSAITQVAILLGALSLLGLDARTQAFAISQGEVAAKLSYCLDCHGPSGQGYHGYFAIPRLAGQQTAYLENQLRAFVERRRPNPIMSNVAHVLSPAMIAALAADFRSLKPRPAADGPRELVSSGEKIFQEGVPDANVAACAACHGPQALGTGQIPRLAGQLYPYLVKELSNWGSERGQIPSRPDSSAIMGPVAHSLSEAQVRAVAAYLSNMK